jgi:MerR-like DNA binding protein
MFTTNEAAKRAGISKNTLLRWMECGLVEDVERDWRGWRIWQHRDIERIKTFQVAYHSKPRERMRRRPVARAVYGKDAALSMGSFGRGYIEQRGIRG